MDRPLRHAWIWLIALTVLLLKVSVLNEHEGRNIKEKALNFTVVGVLQKARFYPSKYEKNYQEYYRLDLVEPACLLGAWSGSKIRNIRSVHVYALDHGTSELLDRYNDMHVSVQFAWVYEKAAPDHRHPMVGAIKNISPIGSENSESQL